MRFEVEIVGGPRDGEVFMAPYGAVFLDVPLPLDDPRSDDVQAVRVVTLPVEFDRRSGRAKVRWPMKLGGA